MNDLIVVPQTNQWRKLKALVLDSVSSPITKRVYNLGLDEFFGWFGREPRPGFTKATVSAWRVALEARGLGSVSINVRITAVRKLAAEAADNGLLAPELAAGIARVKSAKSIRGAHGELAVAEAGPGPPECAGHHDDEGSARPCNHRRTARLWLAAVRGGGSYDGPRPAARWAVVHRGPVR
jgi:hypothetical protein